MNILLHSIFVVPSIPSTRPEFILINYLKTAFAVHLPSVRSKRRRRAGLRAEAPGHGQRRGAGPNIRQRREERLAALSCPAPICWCIWRRPQRGARERQASRG